MAEELKRVGLVFKADGAVDFQKSLKEVNASINENRSSFKLAESQWGKNEKAAKKLQDRQKYLQEQTKDYGDKVKILEAQLAELEGAENRDEAAIERKRTALNNAKRTLQTYKDGLEEVESKLKTGEETMKAYADKLEEIGGKVKNAGENLTKRVSAPIAAVGGLAMKAVIDMDEGYDTIITKTGATGDALEGLIGVADNVFNSMPKSMAEVGTAVGEINTRFGATGKELEDLTRRFLKYAEINGTDVNDSIRLVARAMGDAGIPMDECASVLDKLTVASQASGIEIGLLTENLAKYGAPMRALGLTTEESIAIFAGWEKAGVNTEIAFSGMKKAIGEWGKEGKDAREEFKQTLQAIGEAPDIATATAMAIEVFGQKAGPDLADAIQGGRFEYQDFLDLIENSAGVVENTWKETQDPWDELITTMNNVRSAGADLANSMIDEVGPGLHEVSEMVKDLCDWFKALDDSQKNTAVKIGGIAFIIGPIIMFVGELIESIGSIFGLIGRLSGAIGGVAKFFVEAGAIIGGVFSKIGSGIGGILGGISGLGAGLAGAFAALAAVVGIFIYDINQAGSKTKTELIEIKEFWVNIWNTIKTFSIETWNSLKEWSSTTWTNIKTGTVETWTSLREWLATTWTSLKTKTSEVWTGIKDTVTGGWDTIRTKTSEVWTNIKDTVTGAITVVRNVISAGINGAKNTVKTKLKDMHDSFYGTLESIKFNVKSAIAKIKHSFDSLHLKIKDIELPKLPKIQVSGKFSINPPSVPSFSWHAKAVQQAYLLRRAQIFGRDGNGNWLGGGESGNEMIMGQEYLIRMIQAASARNNQMIVDAIVEMKETFMLLFMKFFPEFAKGGSVVIGEREFKRLLKDMGVVIDG